jgi:hypothetical protein
MPRALVLFGKSRWGTATSATPVAQSSARRLDETAAAVDRQHRPGDEAVAHQEQHRRSHHVPASRLELSGGQEDVIDPSSPSNRALTDPSSVTSATTERTAPPRSAAARRSRSSDRPAIVTDAPAANASRAVSRPGAPADDDHALALEYHDHLRSGTTAIASISIRKSGWNSAWTPTHVLAGGLIPEKNCATRAPTAGAISGLYPTM